MIATYVIENSDGQVIGYHRTQRDAKHQLRTDRNASQLLCIKGQYFGEGYHAYRMVFAHKADGSYRYKYLWRLK